MADLNREELVLSHLHIVRGIVHGMLPRLPAHITYDDLASAGAVGLVEAVRRFDPAKGTALGTFAERRIRGAILDDLRERDTLGRDGRRITKRLDEASAELYRKLGREPEREEVVAFCGLKPKIANTPKYWGVSYEDQLDQYLEDADDPLIGERTGPLPKTLTFFPNDASDPVVADERRRFIEEALASLQPRDRMCVTLYFFRNWTMKKIAAELGVNESRVSQLVARGLRGLRKYLSDRGLTRHDI